MDGTGRRHHGCRLRGHRDDASAVGRYRRSGRAWYDDSVAVLLDAGAHDDIAALPTPDTISGFRAELPDRFLHDGGVVDAPGWTVIGLLPANDPSGDPLGDYLESLPRLPDLAADEAMPAHEWRFIGLTYGVTDILEHHRQRLDGIEQRLRTSPATAWQVAATMTWSRPWDTFGTRTRQLAVSEALAHLRYLERRGRVTRETGRPARYAAVSRLDTAVAR